MALEVEQPRDRADDDVIVGDARASAASRRAAPAGSRNGAVSIPL